MNNKVIVNNDNNITKFIYLCNVISFKMIVANLHIYRKTPIVLVLFVVN